MKSGLKSSKVKVVIYIGDDVFDVVKISIPKGWNAEEYADHILQQSDVRYDYLDVNYI